MGAFSAGSQHESENLEPEFRHLAIKLHDAEHANAADRPDPTEATARNCGTSSGPAAG